MIGRVVSEVDPPLNSDCANGNAQYTRRGALGGMAITQRVHTDITSYRPSDHTPQRTIT